MTPSDATSEFFRELERRAHDPLLRDASGSARFDLTNGHKIDHWLVVLNAGQVAVSHANVDAGCVVRAEKALFDGIARGEVNAMAAMLRGDLTADGDLELLMRLQRLFPSRPNPRPTEVA
jgi:putative sterol carrier protein